MSTLTASCNRSKCRTSLAGALLAAAATTGTLVATATAADAATIRSGAPIMAEPTPYSLHLGGPIGNMPFTMRCWVDAEWANGTNRWFFGNAVAYNHRTGRFNMIHGYVSAAYVSSQDRVGRC